MVLGDLNIHLDNPSSSGFLSLMSSFDVKLVQSPPTHKAGKALDLIFTRNGGIDTISVTLLHLSDHYFIHFSSTLHGRSTASSPMVSIRRNLRNLAPNHFSLVASTLPSSSTFSAYDVNHATESLCSTLCSCLNNLCPLATRPARSSQLHPWLNDTLRTLCSSVRAAERKWRKTKDPGHQLKFHELLSSFSASITDAKKAFYTDKILSSTDSQKLFSTFKTLLNPPSPPPTTRLSADTFASFFIDKVAAISKQFTQLATPEHSRPQTPSSPTISGPTASFSSFSPLNVNCVFKLLMCSRSTTCPLDPIPTKLLQAIAPTVATAVTHVINASLTSGTFPTSLKHAQVKPLLKKSLPPNHVANYQPISLLPFLSKVIERVAFKQITEYLSQNCLLDPYQSGFKKGHSTETALLAVNKSLKESRATAKSSVLILLDLSAAFDTVNHGFLLSTLSSMGITEKAHAWFESYLTGQSFSASWLGQSSTVHQLATGVPQGSVLGPLLFAMYTTSLGEIIRSNGFSYHCYADATQLYLSFPPDDHTVSARISNCLSDISKWMKSHHLQLNLSKTELLVILAKPSVQHNVSIQNGFLSLAPSKAVRNLGVVIDEHLTFKEHVASVACSCRFALYNI
uniref:Reverse transcriptase domain-containing protein n=1 Tax=Nothobranchius furzeri TaxID=105023 RepID=A0A8C6KMT6_NOTFU